MKTVWVMNVSLMAAVPIGVPANAGFVGVSSIDLNANCTHGLA